KILPLLDGHHSLSEILDQVFIGKYNLYQLLEKLEEKGFIRPLRSSEIKEKYLYYRELGKLSKSLVFLESLCREAPQDMESQYELAELYKEMDNLDAAIEVFHRLGNEFLKNKKYDKALEVYQEALRLQPSNLDIHEKLFYLYLNQNQLDQAKKTAALLAREWKKEGQYELVERIYSFLIQKDPDFLTGKLVLAEALAKKKEKNISQAVLLYEEVAREYELVGKIDMAGKVYRILLEIHPHHQEAQKFLKAHRIGTGNFPAYQPKPSHSKGSMVGLWIGLAAVVAGVLIFLLWKWNII
ncbi:MAG: tetratricopeptide repeat protein, partial [Planctomycetota bacterium]